MVPNGGPSQGTVVAKGCSWPLDRGPEVVLRCGGMTIGTAELDTRFCALGMLIMLCNRVEEDSCFVIVIFPFYICYSKTNDRNVVS
jgi:hypothetical protein